MNGSFLNKGNFLTIVITSPDSIEYESGKIVTLLNNGVDYLHIRKPNWEKGRMENLIESIPEEYYSKLKLHDHYDLVVKYGLGGIQLNSRNSIPVKEIGKVSFSAHSVEEVENKISELRDMNIELEYSTLSPIFDSFSKTGYKSRFDIEDLKSKIKGKNVIALGGVEPELFNILKENEFYGAAMLGCVWKDLDDFIRKLNKYKI